MDTLLQELIVFLQDASPLIWSALMKQVYANAVECLFFCVVCLAIAVLLFRLHKYGAKMKEEESYNSDWETPYYLGTMLGYAFIFIALVLFVSAIKPFYNPEYYAIQLLLSQLGG